MPPRTVNTQASDHDLLIRIDTKVDVLQTTVQETRTALSARIDRLAQEKAGYSDLDPLRKTIDLMQSDLAKKTDKDDVNNIAEKLDSTRRLVFIGYGILAAIQFIAQYALAKFLN